jgi:hypothetical protein|nr:MAG TPA: hypothetical protein [Bacteriophage sp.]
MFSATIIEVGVDINSDLFSNNPNLKNISEVWSNCMFDKREYNADGTKETYPQMDFVNIFKNNTKITNASGLFSVSYFDQNNKYGLLLISKELL